MKKPDYKFFTQIAGFLIGVLAVYAAIKGVSGRELKEIVRMMNPAWLVPVFVLNVFVIFFKTARWQILLKPLKIVRFAFLLKVLIISYTFNNVLPVRFGEAVRVHVLGKGVFLSRVTTAASLVADKILEGLSFAAIVALLFCFEGVPKWMHYGLSVTLAATFAAYIFAVFYSRRGVENYFLKKVQQGILPLMDFKVFTKGFLASVFSWLLQLCMIYLTQVAFGVQLPVWGALLVLVAVNLVVVIPSAPANIGTFELACIVAYAFLGVPKELGLLIGLTYHLIQFVPVTLAGGIILLVRPAIYPVEEKYAEDINCQKAAQNEIGHEEEKKLYPV